MVLLTLGTATTFIVGLAAAETLCLVLLIFFQLLGHAQVTFHMRNILNINLLE